MSAKDKDGALRALQSDAFRSKIRSHTIDFTGGIYPKEGFPPNKAMFEPRWAELFDFSGAKTIEEVFESRGYSIKTDKDGNITRLYVDMKSRDYGMGDLLFEAIAPFVKEGSCFCFLDEGVLPEVWLGRFNGEKYIMNDSRGVFDLDGYVNEDSSLQ